MAWRPSLLLLPLFLLRRDSTQNTSQDRAVGNIGHLGEVKNVTQLCLQHIVAHFVWQ